QAKTLQVSGRSWEAYLEKVRLRSDMSWQSYEQRNIFRELRNGIQANPQQNLGVVIPSGYPDAVLKTVEIFGTDRKRASQVVESIADSDDGFDWYIATGKTGSEYFSKSLVIGYPTLGNPYGEPLQFEYPGNI